jgi:L-ascorbate metabolism protein UlaG (beta-lactamase superfamily)
MRGRITFAGHATLLIEIGGTRLLTDPLLRDRLVHLRRQGSPVAAELTRDLDAVLISHLHHDHFDASSLRRLEPSVPTLVPRGGGDLARRTGRADVREMSAGETIELGGVRVTAVPAIHDDRRGPGPRGVYAAPLGFVAENGQRVYFAGDTDVFDEMTEIAPVDVALLPIWGWGPSIGPGHMDPLAAAHSLTLLRPRVAVPIHWGTFYPLTMRRWRPRPLSDPPHEFAAHASRFAPEVEVRILAPGESVEI